MMPFVLSCVMLLYGALYLLGFQVSNRTLDVSGLTRAEYTMIADLVESMSEKNKKLEDM